MSEVASDLFPSGVDAATDRERIVDQGTPAPSAIGLRTIPLLMLIAELVIVVAAAILITWNLSHDDPKKELLGGEAEWLTNFSTLAYNTVHQYGYLPLWQPYLEFGHPAVDNPFSYMLNPFNIVPSIILGQQMGIRISLVLTALIAALGGWVLGRVLGFSWVGRLLLAFLVLGKGNMFGVIAAGFFQLSTSQAYIPWVIAGVIAVLRLKTQRWPILMTALFYALMFFAGDVWYTLPTLIFIVGLVLTHVICFRRTGWKISFAGIDWLALRRMVWAGALTAGLVVVFLLPIYTHVGYIQHPLDVDAGPVPDPASLGFTGSPAIWVIQRFFDNTYVRLPEEYYSYVLPSWFALDIGISLVLLTALKLLVKAKFPPGWWRIWGVVIFIVVFCTMWGIGSTPLFVFLYQTVPLLNQWRFVGRALGVASLGLIMLAAGQTDMLWESVAGFFQWLARRFAQIKPLTSLATLIAALLFLVLIYEASAPIMSQWGLIGLKYPDPGQESCIIWLRNRYPNAPLAVRERDSYNAQIYFKEDVRMYHLSENFGVQALPNDGTIYHVNMYSNSLPEYGLAWDPPEQSYYQQLGFQLITDSPPDVCHTLYRNPNALAYAYTIPFTTISTLEQSQTPIVKTNTTALAEDAIVRHPDHIWLAVNGLATDRLVVTIQELNYPGWGVQIDGKPVKLESIGGQIGVVLPQGATPHLITFFYHPPLLYDGAIVSLLAALLAVLYVLRADRFIPPDTYSNILQGLRRGIFRVWLGIRWIIRRVLNSDLVIDPPPK